VGSVDLILPLDELRLKLGQRLEADYQKQMQSSLPLSTPLSK
jgi:hypothetical protein